MKLKVKRVCVLLPDKQHLDCSFGCKSRGQDVLDEVLKHLGIRALHIFGLAVLRDNEYLFIDLEQKLAKYFGQTWRKVSKVGPSILFLRVHYYVDSGRLISSRRELQLYFIALRQKVLRSQSQQQEAVFFQLAAHALQAQDADLTSQGKHKHYFLPEDYFPSWLIKRRGRDFVLHHGPTLHEELRGLSPEQAVLEYVKLANTVEDVPVTGYRMRRGKKEQKFSILFCVGSNGLSLYQDVEGRQCLLHDFTWTDLEHISFQGCRLEIHAVGSLCLPRLVFYSQSALHSALLLKHLEDSHRFTMSVRDALSHVRLMEQVQACCLHKEAYICDPALLMQRLGCSFMTDGSTEPETSTCEEEEPNCDEDVQESEEAFVDSPEEVLWLAELFSGISVDGPSSDWTAVTMEMKQVLERRPDTGISVD